MASAHRTYLSSMALFWLSFGMGTAFYPRMMQLFMTPEGVAASTSFSDHVWLHDGLDIISVCLLLFALSRLPATTTTLRLAAVVGLLPVLGIAYGLLSTPYWRPLFVVPGLGCLSFAVWGFVLSRRAEMTTTILPLPS
jgi:hypothetical protein